MANEPQHIVIVDDEDIVRDVVGQFLGRRGFRTSVAKTSEELFSILGSSSVDLIVLDVELGDEDGLTILQKIKESNPAIRVVILTGRGYEEPLLQRAATHRADGYISKTMPPPDLLMVIKRVLRTQSTSGPTSQAAA